jgi:hypothetical protein
MRALLLVAAVVAVALASEDVALNFVAGANLSNAEADFAFRYSYAKTDTCGAFNYLVWSSTSVDAKTASSTAKADGDGMIGFGLLPSLGVPPISLFAYGKGSAAVDVKVDSVMNDLFKGAKFDVDFQGSVVAMAALNMQEVNPDGKVVGDKYLLTPMSTCNGKDLDGDEGSLKGLTCTYKAIKAAAVPLPSDIDVTLTYVTSSKAGVIGYGHTPVSPRTFETIIEVKGFPLSDDKNHVRMNLGFLAVTAGIDLNASATEVIHRDGMEDIYIAASERAVVNGERVDVNVDIAAKAGDTDIGSIVQAAMKLALGASFDARITKVDFPAGAKDFVYDPAVGAGRISIYEASAESATTAALSLLVALISILVFLF